MMYYRRKILLKLIAAFGKGGIEKIRLQKMLFLLSKKQELASFDFVPFKYGPYSFQAAKDLSVLETHLKLIQKRGDRYFPCQDFDYELKGAEKIIVRDLLKEFQQKSSGDVVNYVYDHYPYFTINSERGMSAKQKRARTKEKKHIEAQQQPRLFTIGYEGKSIDAYLNLLVENNITLLCDVRKNPLSMKYGFAKKKLMAYCQKLGIAYEDLPVLGVESQKRQALNDFEDYQRLFKAYNKALPSKAQVLSRIMELMQQYPRIALTCFEKDHTYCHRHCISDFLEKKYQLDGCHL